jgi:ankyrin repeat protein
VEPWIDMSIRATWRDSGNGIQSKPMTPLEYAEHAAKGEGSKWRKKIDEELAILRSLDHTEQIKAALLRKDAGMAGRLLDRRPDLLKPMLWPTAVFQAKSLELTRLLLDRGLNPDECTAPRKPLHLAVYQCLPDIVELLIERGADVNLRNPLDETPLDLLDAYEPRPVGDPDAQRIRRALREAGAKDDFYTVIRAGEAVRVRAMLEADPALAKADSSLGGPLFVASRSGRAEVVSVLLEFGADPNKVNSKGNTPLWFAAQSPAKPASSRIAVMKLLLEAGADLNHRCENGTTALHFAAWRGPAEVVEFLLFQGAKNWITDDNGKTPLDHAREMSVAEDKEAIIALLNQPRIKDPHFRAAVTALTNGDLAGLQRLLHDHPHLATAQAEENGEFAGPYFSRPYLLEFVPENPIRTRKLPANVCAIAQALIDAGSPKAALDKTLKLAASGCVPRECGVQAELLELLVQNGADPAVGLEGAVSQGEEGAAALLLRLGAVPGLVAAAGLGDSPRVRGLIPAASPREKERALNAAFRYARKETAEALLDSGIPLDREILDFGTPLHHAASFGHEALCQWLIERGADPAAKDSQWEGTPAGWAAHHGHPGLSAFLQQAEAGGKAMAKPAGDLDRQVVQAVLTNDLSTLQRLLEAHPEKRALTGGQWNKPLLHCAAWEGHLPMVRELLRRGADVNARCESDQACAVHFAAEKGHLEIVRVLAEAGADLEAPDNDHQLNVLGWATALGKCQMEVARFLLARGARQTIWSAVSLNDAEAVRALVQADPGLLQARMSRNEYFRTPLHQAVHAEQPEMVRLLLELGADPGAKDAMGLGPIGAGATVPDAEILAMLEDPEREPALYDALVLGRFEEAEKLLARDPGCLKAGGSEARLLVYAVSRKNGPMAEWLAAHGCDINAVAEVYQCPATALHFAVEQGNLDRIRWLLDLGADPSIRDGKYDADALGWAEFFGNAEAADLIRSRRVTPTDKKKGGVS